MTNRKLTQKDYANFAESFCSPEFVDAFGIFRAGDEEGARFANRKRTADVSWSSVVYPHFDPKSGQNFEYCLKPDAPEMERGADGTLKPKYKYVFPAGKSNIIYAKPGIPAELLNDISKPVLITEGKKQLIALTRMATGDDPKGADWRFLPIAFNGVWGWKGKVERNVKGVIPQIEDTTWRGRKTYIVYDADSATNEKVQIALTSLAKELQRRGAVVFIVNLPIIEGFKGIDDLLGLWEREVDAKTAIEKGLKLIESAQPFGKQKKQTEVDTVDRYYVVTEGDGAGTFYTEDDNRPFLICSPIEVLAVTQTEIGDRHGRLLRWRDRQNRVHVWAMPIELLYGDGLEMIKYLVSRGLRLDTARKNSEKLKSYINTAVPEKNIICTDHIGWHDDVYIFPDEMIGERQTPVVYQPEFTADHKFKTSGTFEEWQQKISKYCIGNSRLAFGVSIAFAATLLPIVGQHSCGFNGRGTTSTGKTTLTKVSGSVFGGNPDSELGYGQSWHSTANGLELLAEMHNHSLLILDELGQIDAREAGSAAYMLATGEGKKRMGKQGGSRRSYSWQLLFLSTGEISLADKMREAELTVRGGQQVRVLDFPADTGKFGVFENLHEFPNGQTFADYLSEASKKYFGTAIREFLRRFIALGKEQAKINWIEFKTKFIEKILLGNTRQLTDVNRAADRFALVAFAGEIATKLGITGWQSGEASKAAETIFHAWYEGRGNHQSTDGERAVSQIRAFIEAHGSSRFQMLNASDESLDTGKIINRAGFKRKNNSGEFDFLFLPEVFRREVCKGFDYKFVCKTLAQNNCLELSGEGKFQKQARCGDMGLIRVYLINSTIMGTEAEENEKPLSVGVTN